MLNIKDFYEQNTGTFSYVIYDHNATAIVIDPVLDYDLTSGRVSDNSASQICDFIEQNQLNLEWVLETHAHADHLTAAQQIKSKFGANIAIGEGITAIQKTFKTIYGFDDQFDTSGESFDRLLKVGERFKVGSIEVEVMATPGHTRDSLSYKIDNHVFIGDTLFHPTIGTARCDFPGGDAGLLFDSITQLLSLPDETILCLCHDYPGDDRKPEAFITIARMKQENIHWQKAAEDKNKFIKLRKERDEGLALPKLIIPSLQVNCRAGLTQQQMKQPLIWPINQF